MKPKILLVLFSFIFHFGATAQKNATLSGRIFDNQTGESLPGANILIEGSKLGGITDFEGNFLIPGIPAGNYSVRFTYVGYVSDTIQIKLSEGEVKSIDFRLNPNSSQLKEAEITSSRITNTENAVLAEMRQADQLINGVSAQQISKTQDRTASDVIKRLPGVTVIEDRFIMLRGLNERYNQVLLNDGAAPGIEADKRAFSFDLIPGSMIDRLIIYKTAAPELPGDFAGGVIKIYTRNIPDEDFLSVTYTTGVRSNTTGNEFYRASNGSKDWLGTDDGTRELPSVFPNTSVSGLSTSQQVQLAKMLPNTWIAKEQSATPDHRFGLSFAKSIKLNNIKISTINAVNYSNTYEIRKSDNYNYNTFDKIRNQSDTIYSYQDQSYQNKISWAALSNWSLLLNSRNKIEFRHLLNQTGNNSTTIRTGENIEEAALVRNYAYRFNERFIYSGQLSGNHDFNSDNSKISWTAGYNFATSSEPDYRRIRTFNSLTDQQDIYFVQINQTPSLQDAGRFFSKLKETHYTGSLNLEQDLFQTEDARKFKLKTGVAAEKRNRDFEARWLSYVKSRTDQFDNSITMLPVDQIFIPQNFNDSTGLKIDEGTNGTDKYTASNSVYAAYASLILPLTNKFTVSGGLRAEFSEFLLQSMDINNRELEVDNPLLHILPSINASYNLSQKGLLRAAYAMTINRPEFREVAPYTYYDFIQNNVLFGNPGLETPEIHNADIRYEYYPAAGEIITFGIFGKQFINPVEQYFKPGAGSGGTRNFEFRNAPSATSVGTEIELRKSLNAYFPSGFASKLNILFNAAYIISKVDFGDDVAGQDKSRPMMGQSPYTLNTGIFYNDRENSLQVNLQYNVIGRRLYAAGTDGTPDVYEMPRNLVDISVTKGIGKYTEIKAGVQDLLNEPVQLLQDSNDDNKINSKDETLFKYNRGSYFTLGITVKI